MNNQPSLLPPSGASPQSEQSVPYPLAPAGPQTSFIPAYPPLQESAPPSEANLNLPYNPEYPASPPPLYSANAPPSFSGVSATTAYYPQQEVDHNPNNRINNEKYQQHGSGPVKDTPYYPASMPTSEFTDHNSNPSYPAAAADVPIANPMRPKQVLNPYALAYASERRITLDEYDKVSEYEREFKNASKW